MLDLAAAECRSDGFLPNGCSYQGCDLVERDTGTVICDFNAGEFPTQAAGEADIIVMLGVLEYIVDVESFFTHLRFCKHDVVLSYCATDLTGGVDRAALGWSMISASTIWRCCSTATASASNAPRRSTTCRC